MKKSLVIIALSIFILTSAIAIACDCEDEYGEQSSNFIGSVNFSDRNVHFLDHTNNSKSGNWITLGIPDEERTLQLPKVIKFTYSGPKSIEYRNVSVAMNKSENETYTVQYPSASNYKKWPVYLPGENVTMSFFGESALKDKSIEIFLLNVTTEPANRAFEAYNAGDTQDMNKLFHKCMDGYYQKYNASLDKKGDLINYNLGPLGAGQYCIVMLQQNENGHITIISSVGFRVAQYQLSISGPESIKQGKDLDITLDLKNTEEDANCTYGAVLIKDEAYKLDIKIDSDGTKNGTNITLNDLNLFEQFGVDPKEFTKDHLQDDLETINRSNYRSEIGEHINRSDIQKGIQSCIGEGSIAMGKQGQKNLSLTAFELPKGKYYLFVGAYSPGKGIVGVAQSEIKIKSNTSGDDSEDNDNVDDDDDDHVDDNDDDNVDDDDDDHVDDGDDDHVDDDHVDDGGDDQVDDGNDDDSEDDSGHGGTSGNGGGSGSWDSPESSKNIACKELCQMFISNGDIIKFEFKKGLTCINYVQFKAKKNAGKTTATVEELKGKSALTPDEPAGDIYKHVNIWIGKNNFANSNNIENAVVGFKVSKNWIDKNYIDINSLVLQHFSNKKWTALPTQKTGEDENYVFFEAKAPSFSPFAISAQKNVMSIEKGTDEKTPSKVETNGKTGTNTQKETSSEENKDQTIFKAAAFFAGLAIVLIIGAVVLRKK